MHNEDLLFREEVFRIIGAAIAVLNSLRHGFHEKPYENAMAVEFRHLGIPYTQQTRFPILHRDIEVAEYIPDLIAFDSIVVDAKVIDRITDHERGQMLNYLRVSGLALGLIINFKHAKLEWERIVLSDHSR